MLEKGSPQKTGGGFHKSYKPGINTPPEGGGGVEKGGGELGEQEWGE